MKKLLLLLMFASSFAFANFTFVIPQKVGGGTSVWASIVAKELEKQLDGDKISLLHLPSARGIGGFNKFHNEYRGLNDMVMVSHGGNGISFLQENVDYDYRDYESIGLMNLTIIVGRLLGQKCKDFNGEHCQKISFAFGSGQVPETMAITMLESGITDNVDDAVAWWKENVTWVKGMKGSERRLAFKRGELNVTRENPAAYKKHVETFKPATVWFTHGLLAPDGSHVDDPNYPNKQFEILFERKWGKQPEGVFYDSYKLAKSFRDGLQKALWVHKDNPNKEYLREALRKMNADPKSREIIQKKVGNYEWIIGEDGNAFRDKLMSFINPNSLMFLVKWNQQALDLKSVLKTWLYLDDFDIGEPSPSLMVQEGDTCHVVPNTFIVCGQ